MKKMNLVIAAATLPMIGMQSCKKEEGPRRPVLKTVTVQLKANASYAFILPRNERNDPYEIVMQSTHSSISEVGTDASGNRIYHYTPSLNYIGTDQVVVANPKEDPQHQGNCHDKPKHHFLPHPRHNHGEEEEHYIITINFTVEDNSTVATR